jgi:hypothetical protein
MVFLFFIITTQFGAGIAQRYSSNVTDLTTDESRFPAASTSVLRPAKLLIQRALGTVFPTVKRPGRESEHSCSRMHVFIPPFSYTYSCLVNYSQEFYFFAVLTHFIKSCELALK